MTLVFLSFVERSDNIDFGWPDLFEDVVDSICFGGADFMSVRLTSVMAEFGCVSFLDISCLPACWRQLELRKLS